MHVPTKGVTQEYSVSASPRRGYLPVLYRPLCSPFHGLRCTSLSASASPSVLCFLLCAHPLVPNFPLVLCLLGVRPSPSKLILTFISSFFHLVMGPGMGGLSAGLGVIGRFCFSCGSGQGTLPQVRLLGEREEGDRDGRRRNG